MDNMAFTAGDNSKTNSSSSSTPFLYKETDSMDPWNTTDNLENVTSGNFTNSTKKPRLDMYYFWREEHIILLCVLLVAIIIGNVLVLLAIGFSKRGQRSRMNFFIMHLAIADISVALVSVSTDLAWKVALEWHGGNVICKIVRFMQSVVMYASTYVLVALSIDRLDAIARPLSFSGSGLRAKLLVCAAWAFSVIFSLPMLFINREMIMDDGTVQCWISFGERWQWQVYITLIACALFIIPAFIIAVCYAVIIFIIWTKSKVLTPSSSKKSTKRFTSLKSNGTPGESKANGYQEEGKSSSRGIIPQAKIRTIKMTLVIVIVFILCWSPYFIFNLLDVYGHLPKSRQKKALAILIQSLGPLNSVANPIIYGIFSTRICRNLRRVPVLNRVIAALCCCTNQARLHDRNAPSMYSTSMAYTSVGTGSVRTRMRDINRRVSGPGKGSHSEKETEILMKNLSDEQMHARDEFRKVAIT